MVTERKIIRNVLRCKFHLGNRMLSYFCILFHIFHLGNGMLFLEALLVTDTPDVGEIRQKVTKPYSVINDVTIMLTS